MIHRRCVIALALIADDIHHVARRKTEAKNRQIERNLAIRFSRFVNLSRWESVVNRWQPRDADLSMIFQTGHVARRLRHP